MEKKQGTFFSRLLSQVTATPSHFLLSVSVGIQLSMILFIFYSGKLLYPFLIANLHSQFLALLGHVVLAGLTFLFVGEFLPTAVFRNNPNAALKLFLLPIFVCNLFFAPFVFLLIQLSKFVLSAFFRIELQTEKNEKVFGQIDLDNLLNDRKVELNANNEIEHEVKLVQNALEFADVKLRDFLVPRTEIAAVEIHKPMHELRRKFTETGFSKILIYEGSIDNIIGYVHSLILFSKPIDIQSCILPITVVPETMPADKLLRLFTTQKKSIALVVDEFGGTAGIVTIEDVMEQIFGEIEDEHDTPEMIEKMIKPEEYVFSARLEIEYLNEKYEFKLPESDDYNTLAGLILSENEDMPKLNQEIVIGHYLFKIIKASSTKIDLVKMKPA